MGLFIGIERVVEVPATITVSKQIPFQVVSLKNSRDDGDSLENNSYMEDRKEKNESALALVKPPHLKWFALLAFLIFGLYTT